MSSQRVVIVGGGEHARVVAEAILSLGALFELIGFVDPTPCGETVRRLGLPRLGDDRAIPADVLGVIAVGSRGVSTLRAEIATRLAGRVAGWATIVHRAAWVSSTASIGPGGVVMAGAVVQTGARTGAHTVVNTGAIVEHDVILGDHAQIAPGARIGGGALVGEGTYVGLGACVRDHIRVGSHALIAMGAVVISDVADGSKIGGVPARALR